MLPQGEPIIGLPQLKQFPYRDTSMIAQKVVALSPHTGDSPRGHPPAIVGMNQVCPSSEGPEGEHLPSGPAFTGFPGSAPHGPVPHHAHDPRRAKPHHATRP